eukprot:1445319-Pyramimonas_sp.AAC.1
MDNVLTSNRNRMKWENVEAIIYIQQNAKQLEKREAIDYEAQFVAWTDGTEENTSWQDAWQEQREGVAGPESDVARQDHVARATAYTNRMAASAARRIRPADDATVPAGSSA